MTPVEKAHWLIDRGDAGGGLSELQRSAGEGDPSSLLELAIWYLEGRYVRRDLALARENFRRAGQLGDTTAEHAFISFLANGVGGAADWQSALAKLTELARTDERAVRQIELVDLMRLTDEGYPAERAKGVRLSTTPDAWTFPQLLSREECAYLISAAEPLLQQSVIVDPLTGQLRPHPIRTSDGAAFPFVSEDLVITALNRRIAAASGTDPKCGEPLQVLRYRPGQEYRPHMDALPTGDNQRILTMLVYLNEGYCGGETCFTRSGLKFSGKPGEALLFRNSDAAGLPDPNAEHAGLPVTQGLKFIATRWIRGRPLLAV